MHTLEPYFNWQHHYIASNDKLSPFFNKEYSEFEFTHAIYDHVIHPQWDDIESATLFIKVLYVNYNSGFAIIEMMGEWNDCLYNDIMFLKRNLIDPLIEQNIKHFILIGENVLNFHAGDDDYYDEWFDDIEEGWIATVNFRQHVVEEFCSAGIDSYIAFGTSLNHIKWKLVDPEVLYKLINKIMIKRLSIG